MPLRGDDMPETYEIHPAIGIAGPEPECPPPAKYRDLAGDLKRGVARFRIFICGRDEQGNLLDAKPRASAQSGPE